eukprot:gene2709-biopygen2277
MWGVTDQAPAPSTPPPRESKPSPQLREEGRGISTQRPSADEPKTSGDIVSVTLTRRSFETWVRWGLCLKWSDKRLPGSAVLNGCAKGSIAVQSAEVRRCVGMEFVSVNGVRVKDNDELVQCTGNCTCITLAFRAPEFAPAIAKSAAQGSWRYLLGGGGASNS